MLQRAVLADSSVFAGALRKGVPKGGSVQSWIKQPRLTIHTSGTAYAVPLSCFVLIAALWAKRTVAQLHKPRCGRESTRCTRLALFGENETLFFCEKAQRTVEAGVSMGSTRQRRVLARSAVGALAPVYETRGKPVRARSAVEAEYAERARGCILFVVDAPIFFVVLAPGTVQAGCGRGAPDLR